MKDMKIVGLLFAILAFVSGILCLIKYFMNFSLPTLAISIGSMIAGFGFIAVIIENES